MPTIASADLIIAALTDETTTLGAPDLAVFELDAWTNSRASLAMPTIWCKTTNPLSQPLVP